MSASKVQIYHVIVPEAQADERLDKFLSTLDFITSRSRAVALIDRGLVTIKGYSVKASHRIQVRDQIQIEMPPALESALQPLDRPLDILYQDQDLVVVNKPSGLVVHPAAGHAQDTLVNILLHHVDNLSMGFGENRPGIVHRLDRDTSGILVVAKNDFAHHALAAQFRAKTVHRIYWAIVAGTPPVKEQTLRSHLTRHPKDRKRFASSAQNEGKLAVTHYKVLQSLQNGFSWIHCKLETGRTHQIRVHLSEAHLPIVGDPIYGSKARSKYSGSRLALHACELGFEHPRSHEMMFYRVGWPADLEALCTAIGFKDV